MKTSNRQRGMSSIGWLVLLSVIGFFLLLLFKIGPLYMANMNICASLRSMAQKNPDLTAMSNREIRSDLSTFMTINSVGLSLDNFNIVRQDERVLVNNVYEARVHILYNIDAVVSFKNQLNSEDIEHCCKYLIENEKKETP